MEIEEMEDAIQQQQATVLGPLVAAKKRLDEQIETVQVQIDGLQEEAKEAALQAALGAPADSLQAVTTSLSAAKEQLNLLRLAHGEVAAKINEETDNLNCLVQAKDRATRTTRVRALANAKLSAADQIDRTVATLRTLMDGYYDAGAQIEATLPQADHKMREKLANLRGRGRILSFIEHVVEGYPSPSPPFMQWEQEALVPFLSYTE
jgi:chromosome segregation ATPase